MSNRVRNRLIKDKDYADDWSELFLIPGAPRIVIDAAYKALSKQYHPDTGYVDERAQARLNAAYDRLVAQEAS
jgi:DnaJ-class molecular chaperone